jgi:PleD family two-component response regulator
MSYMTLTYFKRTLESPMITAAIIESDIPNSNRIKRILNEEGIDIVQIFSKKEAFDILEKLRFEYVVLSHCFSTPTLALIAEQIRSCWKQHSPKIVFISPYDNYIELGSKIGTHYNLKEPLDISELKKIIAFNTKNR